ncbi:gag-pol fusion protein [Gigaspora margarita]|uniref:Gag-pol fusion protein n=1 Tax=Gigaspora margarita TaxID=4874 RepID=A0A8H3XIR4_GIGMA|nr:gag-pol fusion protein [Gigaspora margarita]
MLTAETLAATNWHNINPQRRTDEQDDLIYFEPREYDDGYASSTYSEYTVRATTPMPIYYEIQLNKEEENDDHIVIADPNDVLVLPLHDVVTDNQYGNINYQNKYKKRYLYQQADRTYTHRSQRLQINNSIVALWNLELTRIPLSRRAAPILHRPAPNQLPPNPLAQQSQPPNLPDQQPAPRAAAANPIEQLLQSMNHLILAMDRLKKELREPVEIECPTTIQQALKKPKATKAAYSRGAPLKATSCESESAGKVELVDPSNNILDQPITDNVPSALTLNSRKDTPDILPIEVNVLQRKYPLEVVESLPIVISKVEIPIDIEVTKAKDYTIIVGTNWLGKVKEKIDLARRVLEYKWKNEKYQMPITCWKKITYSLEKPIPLDEKNRVSSEERHEEENGEEYESEEVEEKMSYIVQGDKDEVPIVEQGPNTICWYDKSLSHKADSCAICHELSKEMDTLECLVDDLNKELEIEKGSTEDSKLEKEQQIRIEELLKRNKDLFVKGLTQLERMKEEVHKIVIKKKAKPIKQRSYQVSHTENNFIKQEVEQMIKHRIVQESTSLWSLPVVLVKKKNIFYIELSKQVLANRDESAGSKKMVFVTKDELYEFLVIPFRLINTPTTFQRIMNKILQPINRKFVLVYLDDINIHSKTFDKYLLHLQQVFDLLRKARLRLSKKKC